MDFIHFMNRAAMHVLRNMKNKKKKESKENLLNFRMDSISRQMHYLRRQIFWSMYQNCTWKDIFRNESTHLETFSM